MLAIAQTSSQEQQTSTKYWLRFPVNRVINNPRLEGIAAKAIWLVIPLQYYVLTRFSGGFSVESYVPAAAMALTCVTVIIFVSWALALVHPRDGSYRLRGRGLTIALLMIWSAALALLASSYAITSL